MSPQRVAAPSPGRPSSASNGQSAYIVTPDLLIVDRKSAPDLPEPPPSLRKVPATESLPNVVLGATEDAALSKVMECMTPEQFDKFIKKERGSSLLLDEDVNVSFRPPPPLSGLANPRSETVCHIKSGLQQPPRTVSYSRRPRLSQSPTNCLSRPSLSHFACPYKEPPSYQPLHGSMPGSRSELRHLRDMGFELDTSESPVNASSGGGRISPTRKQEPQGSIEVNAEAGRGVDALEEGRTTLVTYSRKKRQHPLSFPKPPPCCNVENTGHDEIRLPAGQGVALREGNSREESPEEVIAVDTEDITLLPAHVNPVYVGTACRKQGVRPLAQITPRVSLQRSSSEACQTALAEDTSEQDRSSSRAPPVGDKPQDSSATRNKNPSPIARTALPPPNQNRSPSRRSIRSQGCDSRSQTNSSVPERPATSGEAGGGGKAAHSMTSGRCEGEGACGVRTGQERSSIKLPWNVPGYKPLSNGAKVEYRVVGAITKDFMRILKRFFSTDEVRYSDFVRIWKEEKMSLLFAGRKLGAEQERMTRLWMRVAASCLTTNQTYKTHVCAIYSLYALYTLQLCRPKIKVRLSPEEGVVLGTVFQESLAGQHYDVVYAIRQLTMELNAVHIAAHPEGPVRLQIRKRQKLLPGVGLADVPCLSSAAYLMGAASGRDDEGAATKDVSSRHEFTTWALQRKEHMRRLLRPEALEEVHAVYLAVKSRVWPDGKVPLTTLTALQHNQPELEHFTSGIMSNRLVRPLNTDPAEQLGEGGADVGAVAATQEGRGSRPNASASAAERKPSSTHSRSRGSLGSGPEDISEKQLDYSGGKNIIPDSVEVGPRRTRNRRSILESQMNRVPKARRGRRHRQAELE